MTENLFIDALTLDMQTDINKVKENKAFALRLINDLDKLFYTNYQIEDQQDSVVIRMKRSASSNWYGCFSFTATKLGVKFHSHNLGYYQSNHFKSLGALYEKYKGNGTSAEINFLNNNAGSTRHGHVNFVIPINQDDNIKETLRDIVYLMEQNQYIKRF